MRASRLLLAWAVTLATACLEDPSIPCRPMTLGDADPGTMTTLEHAPLVALMGTDAPSRALWQLRCTGDTCAVHRGAFDDAPANATDSEDVGGVITVGGTKQVLLTGTGHHVLVADHRSVHWFRVRADGAEYFRREVGILCPLASLRNSDWAIVREATSGSCDYGPLKRVAPNGRTPADLVPNEPEHGADLTIVAGAIGEHHVVGRRREDDGFEQLYLIPVDDASPHGRKNGTPGDAILLGGPRPGFSRVLFTPRDEFVVATSGTGDDAVTYVYDAVSGKTLDHFDGELIDGELMSVRRQRKELPGLRAVSPDGSHVALRTRTGALALHDVLAGSRCVVRNARAGDHDVAAFGSDGVLYIEARRDDYEHEIVTWDPATRELRTLAEGGFHLKGAPARRRADGASSGLAMMGASSYLLRDDEAPQLLKGVLSPLLLPRDDDALWLLERSADARTLKVRSLPPQGLVDLDETEAFREPIASRVCISTGTPGEWASLCTSPQDPFTIATDPMPSSEDPDKGHADKGED